VNLQDTKFCSRATVHCTAYATLLAEQGRPSLALRCAKRFSAGGGSEDLNEIVQRLEQMMVKPADPVAQQPAYAPQQPAYAPQQPAYAPQQPAYAPQQPAYAPQQPAYAPPQQQAYAPQQPAYAPQQPAYAPPQQQAYAPPQQPAMAGANGPPAAHSSFYQQPVGSPAPSAPIAKIPSDGFGSTDTPGGGKHYGNAEYSSIGSTPEPGMASTPHINANAALQPGAGAYAPPEGPKIFNPTAVQAAAPTAVAAPAPVPVPQVPAVMPAEYKPIEQAFATAVQRLKVGALSGIEKRQIKLIDKALKALTDALKSGQVDPAVGKLLLQMTNYVNSNSFTYSKQVYDHLVANYWQANKVWLKDLKWLCQLGRKKLEQPLS